MNYGVIVDSEKVMCSDKVMEALNAFFLRVVEEKEAKCSELDIDRKIFFEVSWPSSEGQKSVSLSYFSMSNIIFALGIKIKVDRTKNKQMSQEKDLEHVLNSFCEKAPSDDSDKLEMTARCLHL